MHAVLRRPRVRPHEIVCSSGTSCRVGAKLVPALRCLAGAEPDVPLTLDGRWGDAVEALGAHRSSPPVPSPKSVPSRGAVAALISSGSEWISAVAFHAATTGSTAATLLTDAAAPSTPT